MKHILSTMFAVIPLFFLSVMNIWDIQISDDIVSSICLVCFTISMLLDLPFRKIKTHEVQIDVSEETEVIAKEFMKLANYPLSQEKTKIILNCVNCGAPIKSGHCEYCGTVYKNE